MVVEYIIEKVPRTQEPVLHVQKFPRIPQLYLELLENKKKIKPEFTTKDYQPPVVSEELLDSVSEPAPETAPAPNRGEEEEIDEEDDLTSEASTISSHYSSKDKLKHILNKDKSDTPISVKSYKSEPRITTPRVDRKLPSLKELEAQNAIKRDKVPFNINRFEDGNEDKKRQLMMQFDALRRMYPRAQIPQVSIHENYGSMEKQYENTLHSLSIEKSVDNYKQYLTFSFIGIEWFCGKVLKMDMKGYADQQCTQMHLYEKFLVEIGEKNYMPTKKSWPVEIQLLVTVLVQTALFVLMRNLFKGAGSSIIKTVNEAKVPVTTEVKQPPAPGKPKMKGPTINLDEIPSN